MEKRNKISMVYRPYTEEELKKIQKDYEEGHLTIHEIAEKYGRSYCAIEKLAVRYGWRKKYPKTGKNAPLAKRKIVLEDLRIKKAQQIQRPNIEIEIPSKKLVKIVIWGEKHIPFHNTALKKPLFKFLRDFKPDFLIDAGDLLDFYQISKFRKIPFTPTSLKEDLLVAKKELEELREVIPKTKIIQIEGNHDFRWRTYLIDNAPLLYDLYSLSLIELLDFENLDITYIPCRLDLNRFSHNYVKIGKYWIGHFDKVLKNAGYTARTLRDDLGVNIITGHTHRAGISYRTYLDELKIGAEIGCLCKLEPAYLNNPDWQNAFGILYLKGNQSNFDLVKIENNQFIYGGKVYK